MNDLNITCPEKLMIKALFTYKLNKKEAVEYVVNNLNLTFDDAERVYDNVFETLSY